MTTYRIFCRASVSMSDVVVMSSDVGEVPHFFCSKVYYISVFVEKRSKLTLLCCVNISN